jgi:hypothetical protein
MQRQTMIKVPHYYVVIRSLAELDDIPALAKRVRVALFAADRYSLCGISEEVTNHLNYGTNCTDLVMKIQDELNKTVESRARECYHRLCPYSPKDLEIEKSTTMRAYLEGYADGRKRNE